MAEKTNTKQITETKKMNPIIRNMVKGFIPLISDNMGAVNDYLTGYLAGIELQQEESRASIVCSTAKDGNAYIIVCAFDENDTAVRVVSKMSVTEFITLILKQI